MSPVATTTPDGNPIFERPLNPAIGGAYGFSLVLEARPGGTLAPVGSSTFNWSSDNPTSLPDLQIEVSNKLGNGSPDVCDESGTTVGGIPAVSPFDFNPDAAPAINDLSCRFQNGTGQTQGRDATEACTLILPAEVYQFVKVSTIQYCGVVTEVMAFPPGDTTVAARVRDTAGNLSAVSSIVIRVPSP